MTDHFSSLPPFLKEYIHTSRWTEFRDVQLRAFEVMDGTDSHLLLSSGTSSGKTEAAMFPVIASLHRDPPKGVGALYISPLKALIDDQFGRLSLVLRDSYIELTSWHGESEAGMKERLRKDPSGILQITPESLQGLVYGDPEDVRRLFGDLRFVIIDEVHSFMDSDRGIQLLCCLERMERVTGTCARRIGLSATLSDTSAAEAWLSAATGRKTVSVVCPAEQKRDVRILYNFIPPENPDDGSTARRIAIGRTYTRMFHETDGRSSIIFVNSRITAERTARSLSKMAERMGSKLEVFVHHGSVSKESRKVAEERLRSGRSDVTTVATSTLELGVDIGSLDTILQIGPPHSCSSLLQRMGRSGRRGGAQSLVMMCNDDAQMWWSDVYGVSVNLVRSIAMVELAVKEGWVEPPRTVKCPYGILLQQTMAYLRNSLGAKFTELCDEVLALYPFRFITKDDYKVLIKYMVERGLLDYLKDATLVLGREGERIAFGKGFPIVFAGSKDIEIRFEGKPIGTVQKIPEVGGNILLSGRVWAISSISPDGTVAEVVESDGSSDTSWKSGAPEYHSRVLRKMREVLFSDEQYDYVDDAGLRRLNESRRAAKEAGMGKVFSQVNNYNRICPWIGSRKFDTMHRMLHAMPDVKVLRYLEPYTIDIACDYDYIDLMKSLEGYSQNFDLTELVTYRDDLIIGKYDEYVPESLLMKAFAADRLDSDFDVAK
ncbi:MAG: DEAD/DEAH box helicase [Candidatus Methanomethylophilaceae archaeon]|nr:DEAD/DEAH box helicase [Candidatus Methanomethylophilaceae archaeon]